MKKLILLLFFYSCFAFSADVPKFPRISDHPSDTLVGVNKSCSDFFYISSLRIVNPLDRTILMRPSSAILSTFTPNSVCIAVGFFSQFNSSAPFLGLDSSYKWATSYTKFIDLPANTFYIFRPNSPEFSSPEYSLQKNYYLHSICEADQISQHNSRESAGCDPKDILLGHCDCPNFLRSASDDYLVVFRLSDSSNSQISQKTLSTTNNLISETNSKLGSIATSNAMNSNFLSKIFNSIGNLSSSTGGPSGSNSPNNNSDSCFGIKVVGGCSNVGFDSSGDFSLASSFIDVSAISPIVSSSQFSCPSGRTFSVFNHDYSISYDGLCDFAFRLRSIVIPAARVAAAWIVIGAL